MPPAWSRWQRLIAAIRVDLAVCAKLATLRKVRRRIAQVCAVLRDYCGQLRLGLNDLGALDPHSLASLHPALCDSMSDVLMDILRVLSLALPDNLFERDAAAQASELNSWSHSELLGVGALLEVLAHCLLALRITSQTSLAGRVRERDVIVALIPYQPCRLLASAATLLREYVTCIMPAQSIISILGCASSSLAAALSLLDELQRAPMLQLACDVVVRCVSGEFDQLPTPASCCLQSVYQPLLNLAFEIMDTDGAAVMLPMGSMWDWIVTLPEFGRVLLESLRQGEAVHQRLCSDDGPQLLLFYKLLCLTKCVLQSNSSAPDSILLDELPADTAAADGNPVSHYGHSSAAAALPGRAGTTLQLVTVEHVCGTLQAVVASGCLIAAENSALTRRPAADRQPAVATAPTMQYCVLSDSCSIIQLMWQCLDRPAQDRVFMPIASFAHRVLSCALAAQQALGDADMGRCSTGAEPSSLSAPVQPQPQHLAQPQPVPSQPHPSHSQSQPQPDTPQSNCSHAGSAVVEGLSPTVSSAVSAMANAAHTSPSSLNGGGNGIGRDAISAGRRDGQALGGTSVHMSGTPEQDGGTSEQAGGTPEQAGRTSEQAGKTSAWERIRLRCTDIDGHGTGRVAWAGQLPAIAHGDLMPLALPCVALDLLASCLGASLPTHREFAVSPANRHSLKSRAEWVVRSGVLATCEALLRGAAKHAPCKFGDAMLPITLGERAFHLALAAALQLPVEQQPPVQQQETQDQATARRQGHATTLPQHQAHARAVQAQAGLHSITASLRKLIVRLTHRGVHATATMRAVLRPLCLLRLEVLLESTDCPAGGITLAASSNGTLRLCVAQLLLPTVRHVRACLDVHFACEHSCGSWEPCTEWCMEEANDVVFEALGALVYIATVLMQHGLADVALAAGVPACLRVMLRSSCNARGTESSTRLLHKCMLCWELSLTARHHAGWRDELQRQGLMAAVAVMIGDLSVHPERSRELRGKISLHNAPALKALLPPLPSGQEAHSLKGVASFLRSAHADGYDPLDPPTEPSHCRSALRCEPSWDACVCLAAAAAATPSSQSLIGGAAAAVAGGAQQLALAAFAGCCYRGCGNVDGVSEAALPLRRCSGCHVVRYCSEMCQRRAWVGGHREVCNAWRQRPK